MVGASPTVATDATGATENTRGRSGSLTTILPTPAPSTKPDQRSVADVDFAAGTIGAEDASATRRHANVG